MVLLYGEQFGWIMEEFGVFWPSAFNMQERVKEHLKAPSQIFHHNTSTGYSLDPNNFNIIHKVVHGHSWTIKEAKFIYVNDPTLKRNLGKYQLLHVWDSILQASPMLQLKPSHLPYALPPLNNT